MRALVKKMKFIDFFAGIGGFRKGMELSGHECVGFCEFDKFAVASYTSMHLITEEQRQYLSTLTMKQRQKEILKEEYRNGEWYAGDIRTVSGSDLPQADCWCFGAPCQDFSIAGKRAGLGGDRSSLIREIFRLLEEQEEQDRPEWLIYENVKGMLSSNRGLDYLSILSEMDRLGYDCEWQNINSKWFVPQNRERIYTIGHLRRYGSRKVLPVEGTGGENSVCQIGSVPNRSLDNPQPGCTYGIYGIAPTLNSMEGGGREPRIVLPVLTPDRINKLQNGRRFKEDGEPMFTLTAQDRHGVAVSPLGCLRTTRSEYGKKIRKDYESGKLKVSRHTFLEHEVRTDGCSNTIDSVQKDNLVALKCDAHDDYGDGIYIQLPNGVTYYAIWYEKEQCYITIRKLTPKECFRLQGWTDDYFERAAFVNSDSQLYKQAGNGVTVPVIEEIGKRMI